MVSRGVLVFAIALGLANATKAGAVKFQQDDWVTECDIAHAGPDNDCSIIGVFRNSSTAGPDASYSLLVDLTNGVIAIVGRPAPSRSTIRIDKGLEHGCIAHPYCIFPNPDVAAIRRELETGSVILLDVASANGTSHASLSSRGYQVSIAKLRAEGWQSY